MAKIRKTTTGKKTGSSDSRIMGTLGQNYLVRDVPCLLPKENMSFFTDMQRQAQHSSFGNFPNPYNAWWPKPKK